MSPEQPPISNTPTTCSLGANTVFDLFSSTVRRKMVFSLAREPWQPPSVLRDKVGCTLDSTMKRLALMRSNRIVVMRPDTVDLRRQLYALSPEMCLLMTENGKVFDFGFLKVPLTCAGLAENSGVQIGGVQWMPEVVYSIIGNPTRRKLLAKLARLPAQTGGQLNGKSEREFSPTLKHLTVLRTEGFVVVPRTDSGDGRRQLYSLSPALPVKVHEDTVILDFGFCTVTLSR